MCLHGLAPLGDSTECYTVLYTSIQWQLQVLLLGEDASTSGCVNVSVGPVGLLAFERAYPPSAIEVAWVTCPTQPSSADPQWRHLCIRTAVVMHMPIVSTIIGMAHMPSSLTRMVVPVPFNPGGCLSLQALRPSDPSLWHAGVPQACCCDHIPCG